MDRPPRPLPWVIVAAVALGALVALTGCARAAPPPAAGSVVVEDGHVRIVARDTLVFDVESITAPAGELEIELVCEQHANHNLVIDELDVEVVACGPGRTETGSIVLEPGSYTYVCTVPGHEATMRGSLVVE